MATIGLGACGPLKRQRAGRGAQRLAEGALIGVPSVALLGLASLYAEYRGRRERLRRGEFEVVGGVVQNFTPGDTMRHVAERFEVAGHAYSYPPYVMTVAFHRTVERGGPIREGLRVRIADVDGKIARLEVAR